MAGKDKLYPLWPYGIAGRPQNRISILKMFLKAGLCGVIHCEQTHKLLLLFNHTGKQVQVHHLALLAF